MNFPRRFAENGIITETYEKFCEYIGNANIKGFLVLSDDNSIFKDYVYEYIAKAGYSYKIEDKKGIFYCIKIGADPIFKTKVRVPKDKMKANIIANPTCEKLMSVLNGTYGKNEKKEGNK